MDKEKILKKIIERVEKNGFDIKPYLPTFPNKKIAGKFLQVIYKEFIFSHDFAKALWGTLKICRACEGGYKKIPNGCGYHTKSCPDFVPAWQYHLEKMIMKKDYIKYLAKFIKK